MAFRRNFAFPVEMQADPRYRAGLLARVKLQVVPFVKRRADAAGEPFMPRGGAAIKAELDGHQVVISSSDHGAWIAEVGSPSRNTPASAPLRGGAHDAGLHVNEE